MSFRTQYRRKIDGALRRAQAGCRAVTVVLLSMAAAVLSVASAQSADSLAELARGEAHLLVRHALAPGVGDPSGFDLHDCATQRNLNEEGREQARAMGQWLRDHGIDDAHVYSSQWCRCLETARLMAVGSVTPLPALNSFFRDSSGRDEKLEALRAFLNDPARREGPAVLVTHQVTISALTGVYAASGHGVLVRGDGGGAVEVIDEVDFGL